METPQNNHFDEMLRQSLEGAKLPVPSGVWESVGASIATKAVVATKIAGIKLVIIKSIAGFIVTGGMIWGAYQLFQNPSPTQTNKTTPLNNIVSSNTIVDQEPIETPTQDISNTKTTNIEPSSQTPVSFDTGSIPTSIVSVPLKDTVIQPVQIKSTTPPANTKPEEKKIVKPVKNEQTVKETGSPSSTETTEIKSKEQINLNIPNVFTPYELDGFNDCFRINIENESKYAIQIFDMEGKKVFESLNKLECWDGRNIQTGQMCPRGFYTYKLIYELKTGFKKTERGELNLL